jgi:hypothetical protein
MKGGETGYVMNSFMEYTPKATLCLDYSSEGSAATYSIGITDLNESPAERFIAYVEGGGSLEKHEDLVERAVTQADLDIHSAPSASSDVLGVLPLRRCYHPKHPLTYPQSLECAKKLCELAREQFGGVSSEGAFDFIAPDLDYGLYISFVQGGKGICDQPVPFWQLVYHGTVLSNPYACTVNSTFKTPDCFLKLLEYGGRPTFYYYSAFLSDGRNSMGFPDCTCDTQEELVRSVANIKKACDVYHALADTHFAYMQKHEQVGENVFETTYSNGTVVRVDYGQECYEILTPNR